ncbi:rhodanese-like domain-containing protein [Elioraea rosea]|uniref:rhodanese-like domain-containing protein n=1 Tax=Elioraea rosea TaxID=2492390 RepID=UPI00118294DD|nr:rhodanese-like domain-containing protein [Elioraea rosea]
MRFPPERAVPLPDPRDPAVTIADVERAIRDRHPVPHLTPEQAEGLIAEGHVAVFDVRSGEEFESGHLPGSVRIEPGLSPWRFAAAHGAACSGRIALFICSVGLRSARLAETVTGPLSAHRPMGVANLSGGLFRWLAERRRPALPGLHPYDDAWRALLLRMLDSVDDAVPR